MKQFLVAVLIVGTAAAQVTCFNFDAAPVYGGAEEIEAYMESVAGFNIDVTGGVVGNGVLPSLGEKSLADYSGDRFIHSSYNLCGTDTFSFYFEKPVCAVSFQWGTRNNLIHAEGDGTEFFACGVLGVTKWKSGTTSYVFTSPIHTLTFHNSGLGEISIDQLCITVCDNNIVPLPAASVLAGIGAVFVGWMRKRRIV